MDDNFDESTKTKAKQHLKFLTDKNAFATIVFNTDAMTIFKQLSLDFQQRYSSLVGQKDKEMVFRFSIEDLKNGSGDNFKRFLKDAICFTQDPVDGMPCETLDNYEKMNVYYAGLQFYDHDLNDFPKLSTFYQSYIERLLESIEKYFPMEVGRGTHPSKLDFKIFEPLNQVAYPENELNKVNFKAGSIEELAKVLNVPYDAKLQKEFDSLVRMLIYDKQIFCRARKSDPLFFWSDVVRMYESMLSPKLRRFLLAANVTPLSSADPERSFSVLNRIKTKDRNQMSPDLTDAKMRLVLNGGSVFDPRPHTVEYLKTHDRCDIPSTKDRKVPKKKFADELDEEYLNDEPKQPENQKILLGKSILF